MLTSSSDDQEWLKPGVALLSKKRKYSAYDGRFNFSQNDDDFKELAKGNQPKNAKLSNCWALKICSE